jgi:hypothetical protein
MAELLFIATTIFVVYVLFVVMAEKKESPEPDKSEVSNSTPPVAEKIAVPAEVAVSVEEVVATPIVVPRKPTKPKSSTTKKAVVTESPVTDPPVAAASTSTADSLKNPNTGEVVKIPANYTFAKRWIKDALVEEGLLDKIYKSNELDDATQAKIQGALQQLKSLDKYKA